MAEQQTCRRNPQVRYTMELSFIPGSMASYFKGIPGRAAGFNISKCPLILYIVSTDVSRHPFHNSGCRGLPQWGMYYIPQKSHILLLHKVCLFCFFPDEKQVGPGISLMVYIMVMQTLYCLCLF